MIVAGTLACVAQSSWAQVPPAAVELRNLGLAQLENERPADAEATFRKLQALLPADPLPAANLAIALLRQQKGAEALPAIAAAQRLAPGRGDLLAIEADVLQWSGETERALAVALRAAAAAPDDVEIQYSLLRVATGLGEQGRAGAGTALRALQRLRPENLVVMLQSAQAAIAAGDRAGATGALLRVRELLWQAPPQAAATLQQGLTALEKNDVPGARVPALRLENVLKITPLYQQSLRELSSGIQGRPLERLVGEPPPTGFGDPLAVRFEGRAESAAATTGNALAAGDWDGDQRADLARLTAGGLEVRRASAPGAAKLVPAPSGLRGLLAADLDNDGALDLLGFGATRLALWRGRGDGSFDDRTKEWGLAGPGVGAGAAAVLDDDLEGDLDLAAAGGAAGVGELWRSSLAGPLQAVGAQVLARGDRLPGDARALIATDLDRDGDPDLVFGHSTGLVWLDNLRQGRFGDRTTSSGLAAAAGPVEALASADLDNDGRPELVAAGAGIRVWRQRAGRFESWNLAGLPAAPARFSGLVAFDADNDGRLDLAAAGPAGVTVYAQRGTPAAPRFEALPVGSGPASATAVLAADLDGDGDLDLIAAGAAGLHRLDNRGGNANHWLAVRLRGLQQGSGKNNVLGLGSTLELRAGAAYQFRETTSGVTHFGLGSRRRADLLRAVWTNGVPQNRLQPAGDQTLVEEQLLKGSCPFLYAWNGERFEFVTDLLWAAPLGLPVAPGVYLPANPDELVRVDGAVAVDGIVRLRVTEELWEAAFFDVARLWVVDHPAEVEVASNLRVLPGQRNPPAVLASRALRPLAAAWDGTGEDATAAVRARDEVYAAGYPEGPYQGVAARPWSFIFDLGEAPAAPLRLHLDGWIFPADASLNLAAAQRPDLPYTPPRIEVETAGGWQLLLQAMGLPPGKTKTMVVDLPALPPGARRLRIVSNLWLSWDRIAWTLAPADGEPRVAAKLDPARAELGYRGFSRLLRQASNSPHSFDYDAVAVESPWLPLPGRYTRYGDVAELLTEPDDRTVILAAGDEIALEFDASALPPPPPGWKRTLFLESSGWDKDADRNTYEAQTLEPLPFRAMSGYPWKVDEKYPATEELRRYREEWLTRVVLPER